MKSVQIVLLAFAAIGAAQLQNLPSCAKPCASSLPANCNLGVKCICSDQSFITGISCCIKNACPPADQQKTLQVAVQFCDTVQVTLPSAAACPASAGPSGASSIASSSAATMMASSASSGGQSTASSAMSNAATKSSTGSTSATSTATSSTSAVAATGGAQVLGSNIGAVGAAVAALVLL